MPQRETLTVDEIRILTGHNQNESVRVALRRAGVRSTGFSIGSGSWPPKKVYRADDVWRLFGPRILRHAGTDPDVKEFCWEVFRHRIQEASTAHVVSTVFADRLEG